MSKSAQLRLAAFSTMARGPVIDPFMGPNIERLTADPNVCFIEGDPAADTADAPDTPAPKYTDADLQRAVQTRLAKEQKKYGAELESLKAQLSETEALKARLAELEESAEMAGKSAAEKAQAAIQKQIDKAAREADELRKALAERDARVTQAETTLRTERATRQVMDALASEKAINATRAAKYAMTDIAVSFADDGTVTATYGDVDEGTVAEAVKAWLRDNDNFLPPPPGGAGTRQGGQAGAAPLHERSAAELMKLARSQR